MRRCRRNAGGWCGPIRPTAGGALYIASHAYAIEGLERGAAQKLIDELTDAATAPGRATTHTWRHGDVVMWDNRATMHRGRPWPANEARLMVRTTVSATDAGRTAERAAAVAPGGGVARQLHFPLIPAQAGMQAGRAGVAINALGPAIARTNGCDQPSMSVKFASAAAERRQRLRNLSIRSAMRPNGGCRKREALRRLCSRTPLRCEKV